MKKQKNKKTEKFDKTIFPELTKALEKGLSNLLALKNPVSFLKGAFIESYISKKIFDMGKLTVNRFYLKIEREKAFRELKKNLRENKSKKELEESMNELIKIERRKL